MKRDYDHSPVPKRLYNRNGVVHEQSRGVGSTLRKDKSANRGRDDQENRRRPENQQSVSKSRMMTIGKRQIPNRLDV